MFPYERVHRSALYWARGIAPSGVAVVDGEAYGVRLDDPTGQSPSVTVSIEGLTTVDIELGSPASCYSVIFSVYAKSRLQRDALKQMIYSALDTSEIPIYSDFNDQTPASGATVVTSAEVDGAVIARDIPDFSQGREQFFWTAMIFADLIVIGV